MPKVELAEFGNKPRIDGFPGHREIVPTSMVFEEEDGSDVRMKRVRVYDQAGKLVKTYMLSPMGQKYKNMENYLDDMEYLKKLTP